MSDMKDKVVMDHGSGGRMFHELLLKTLLPMFDNPFLAPLHDGADLSVNGTRLAFSTDSYVVDPIFFPGGSIGDLAINGTVNDLAMCGATPLYLSVGLILEEGFPMEDLSRILADMRQAAGQAGVMVVTGDTKVVPRGAADKIYINTSGIGSIPDEVRISSNLARPGDLVILSGTMGDHGMAVLNAREGFSFSPAPASDTAALHTLTAKLIALNPTGVHVLRDPTRGGVGTVLGEIAESSGVGIEIQEEALPVTEAVVGMCDLLGMDPLYVANEGKFIAVVAENSAEMMLAALKQEPLGARAEIIGRVVAAHPGKVHMKTRIGGVRLVSMPSGEQLPRIC